MATLFIRMATFFTKSESKDFQSEREDRYPKVSVIVPVYKVEPWIRECLDSLVNQTLKEIEIICVDDGSPDNCGTIIDEYAASDPRVIAIHQKNSGVQQARNAGLDVASGEYIAFVDSDDYLDKRTYEVAYKYAKEDDVDILNFKARIFVDGNNDHTNSIDFSDAKPESAEHYMQNSHRIFAWDNLFKYEIIQKDKIRFIPEIKPADDTCFTYMALGRAKRVKQIPATFYNYRKRPGAISEMSMSDMFRNSYKMFEYICNSWRSGNCLRNNEHNLITIIVRWACYMGDIYLSYSKYILNSFGNDILNSKTLQKCPTWIQDIVQRLQQTLKYTEIKCIEDGIYRIVSAVDDNKVLDICDSSKENCASLQIYEDNSRDSQKFIIKSENGVYTLTNFLSRKNIDVAGGHKHPGTSVWQYQENYTCAQRWYIVPCEKGYFKFVSQCNFLTLDVVSAKNSNGTKIQVWEDNGTVAQKFKLIRVN